MSGRPTGAVVVLALAVAASAAPSLRAQPDPVASVLPVQLVDVASGAAVALEPGAKVLHVVVFATWCRPCLDELPGLAEWEARFGGAGYRIAIVALAKRQSLDRLVRFARANRPPGRLFFDASGAFARALRVDGIPTHLLIDETGRVRARSGSLAELEAASVEELLGEGSSAPEAGR